MDELLDEIIKSAYKGILIIGIWFLTPGGPISGTLVSADSFFETLLEHPLFKDININKDMIDKSSEGNQEIETEKTVNLVDVKISMGNHYVDIPWAILRRKDINAWGLGSIKTGLVDK